MGRLGYVLKRGAQTIFILWFIMTFLFFFFRFMPGDYADLMLFQGADAATVEAFNDKWGLDEPIYVQYGRYVVNFLQLDMGQSLQFGSSVVDYVWPKLFNTLVLVGPGITVGYLLSSVIGTVMGNLRGSRFERYGLVVLVTIGSFPVFFIGIVFIIVFAAWLNWFPTSGMISPEVQSQLAEAAWWRQYFTADFAWHYTLPFVAIVLRYLYTPTLIMRTSVVETSTQDFTFYHRITGLPYANRLKHIGRHSILPLITVYPVSMTRAVSGLVLLEMVFNWPGIGYTLIQAVLSRDFPVVQFVFFVSAAFVVIANFSIDLLYSVVDPRISVGEE